MPRCLELEKIAKLLLVYVTRYSILRLDSGGMESTLLALARDVREKVAEGANGKECLVVVKDRLGKKCSSRRSVIYQPNFYKS